MINEGRLKAFPLRSDTRQGCPLSPHLFSIVLEVLEQSDKKKKKNEKLPNQKDVKLSLLADAMIIDVENPKN